MSQTIADYYVQQGREEGREEGRQEFLLTQLEHRFGVLPPPARQKLLAIRDPASLRDLTIRLLDAKSLEELGFN